MTFFDRACLNESLDVLLDRENGKGDEKTAEEDVAEEDRLDREAERGALRAFEEGNDD